MAETMHEQWVLKQNQYPLMYEKIHQ